MSTPQPETDLEEAVPAALRTGLKIALAADHAGYDLKNHLHQDLVARGFAATDLGAHSLDPGDDYPDFAELLATTLLGGELDRGIVVCGSGVGVCVALNKFRGIRAAICHDAYSARQGVEHDNMNVLCLGSRIVGVELAREVTQAFLSASFSGEERHVRRLNKVIAIEKRLLREPPRPSRFSRSE